MAAGPNTPSQAHTWATTSRRQILWVVLGLFLLAPGLAVGQTAPEKTAKEKRQEKREQRKTDKARQDSLAALAKPDTTTEKSKGFFSRLLKGKTAEEIADSVTANNEELKGYQSQYDASLRRGDYNAAKKYLEQFQRVRDSLQFARLEIESAEFLAEMARQENRLLEDKNRLVTEKSKVLAAQSQTQRYLLGAAGLVLLLIGGFAVVLVRSVSQKRKANALLNAKNTELSEKHQELTTAYDSIHAQQKQLAHQHQNIVESIQYARRIQEAILPEAAPVAEQLKDFFIFYRPKDIVSGDFYWFHHSDDRLFIAAVDCTGHGVPGAFMSVLGMSLLNQIVRDEPDLQPGEILDKLNKGIRASLHQIHSGGAQDGMDIALVALSQDRRKLQFSGANNPLYLVRNGELEEFKGDRAPIGGSRFAEHRFSSYTIELEPNDRFYLFSDGMADQFGGPQGRKFTYKRLRELMLSNNNGHTMGQYKDTVAEVFDQWRGEREQIDDVLVIGVRV
jgi:serine phosphatase RsbU (regulator of sigma subunit)